jgi:hypothetical protein
MSGDFSELQSGIYKSLINVSVFVFLIGLATTGKTSLYCYQAGYVSLAFSIMLILIKILNNLQSKKDNMPSIGTIFLNIVPFIIILLSISALLYFNFTYMNIIIEKRISTGFTIFSNIVIILLLIQTYVIYSAVSSKNFDEKGISSVTSGTILLLAVLTGISTNIIRTILKYFTTDGFTSQILKI